MPSIPPDKWQRIVDKMNDRRAELGMSGDDIARATGINRSSVFAYLRGKRVPQAGRLRALESGLNFSPGELLAIAGFAPAGGGLPPGPEAIRVYVTNDPLLSPTEKRLLLSMYKEFVEPRLPREPDEPAKLDDARDKQGPKKRRSKG